jgi:hypothetical protein
MSSERKRTAKILLALCRVDSELKVDRLAVRIVKKSRKMFFIDRSKIIKQIDKDLHVINELHCVPLLSKGEEHSSLTSRSDLFISTTKWFFLDVNNVIT